MAFVPVPQAVQAELVFRQDNQIMQNVLHYESTSAWTPADMQELGSLLVGWWSSDLRPQQVTVMSLVNIKLTDLSTAIAPVINYAVGLPLAGSRAEAAMPNSVTLCITKRTLFRGRSYRGRIYHCGMSELQVTDNSVSALTASNLVDAYLPLLSLVGTVETYTLGVVSRYENGIARNPGIITPVISLDANTRVDTQRRRLPA
jgi:hypothetical protein